LRRHQLAANISLPLPAGASRHCLNNAHHALFPARFKCGLQVGIQQIFFGRWCVALLAASKRCLFTWQNIIELKGAGLVTAVFNQPHSGTARASFC
jgi:hypothetical protein